MPSPRRLRFSARCKTVLRDGLRVALFGLCRLRSRTYRPETELLLVIAPHQDDCTLGCGGLIFQKRLAGHPVEILYLTDGAASHPGHPEWAPSKLATRRREEARLANRRLGVDSAALRFLDLPDGRLDKLTPDERAVAVRRLAAALGERPAAVVLLPLRHDGSSEHEAAFTLVNEALERAALRPRMLEYPVWSAWSPRSLAPAVWRARIHRFDFPSYGARKNHALAAYASQFEPTPPWRDAVLPRGFRDAFAPEREFFFEYPTMNSTRTHPSGPHLVIRVWRRLRFALHGRRAGLGQPVPVDALDREYSTGHWDHFFGPDEKPRHDVLVELIRTAHPRPRLLDLGCGSGRLATLLATSELAGYLGVDISGEGLRRARALALPPPLDRFEQRDFEAWTPAPGAFNVITFNECLGYAPDPLRTARRFAATLEPDGALIVSHFRSGNHAAFWRRLARDFDFPTVRLVTNSKGQTWDLRILRFRA